MISSTNMSCNSEYPDNYGIKLLRLACRNLTTLEPETLEKYTNLEHLDVSKNHLKSIPVLHLPKLRVLNCEDNSIADVTFLSSFPSLEHLYLTGNPVNVADRFIAVDQAPLLQTLDGKPVTEIRSIIGKLEKRLISQVEFYKKEKLDVLMRNAFDEKDELLQLQKQFAREILHSLSAFSSVPVKYRRFKAQYMANQVFKIVPKSNSKNKIDSKLMNDSKNQTDEKLNYCIKSPHVVLKKLDFDFEFEHKTSGRTGPIPVSCFKADLTRSSALSLSPKKDGGKLRIGERDSSSNYFSTRTLQNRKLSIPKSTCVTLEVIDNKGPERHLEMADLGSSPNKQRKLEELQDFDYDPQLFLRCHSLKQDPQDSDVSVWRAAFEPDVKDIRKTTDIVATCGGNIVCFINCITGHVLKRYKNDNPCENLYALAWTVCSISGNNEQSFTILATGGTEKKIHLIHPTMLKCYHSFKAHSQSVNILVFHFSQRTWLFSGGDDWNIHFWDIGQLSIPDFKTSVQKLMTFEGKSAVLQMSISSLHDVLIATTNENLIVWNYNEDNSNKIAKKPSVEVSKSILGKSESGGVIDGLTLVSDDFIAVKVSGVSSIVLMKISDLLNNSKSQRKQAKFVAELIWASCDTSYNYLGSCLEWNYLACGDNEGRIWVYDVSKYLSQSSFFSESNEIFSPNLVLPWPKLIFEKESLSVRKQVIINSVVFNWNGTFMVACSDSNFICIWKKSITSPSLV